MSWFPSVWDLLLPKFTIFSAIGWILIAIVVIDAIFFRGFIIDTIAKIFRMEGAVLNIGMIFGAIVLIWGTSIILKIVTSPGFIIIFASLFLILLVGFLLFYDDIKRIRNK